MAVTVVVSVGRAADTETVEQADDSAGHQFTSVGSMRSAIRGWLSGSVAELVGGDEARVGIGCACFVARMDARQRRLRVSLGAKAEQPIETDRVIDLVGRHASPAAERDDRHADAARVDRRDRSVALARTRRG